MKTTKKKRSHAKRTTEGIVFAALLLFLCGISLLRTVHEREASPLPVDSMQNAASETAAPVENVPAGAGAQIGSEPGKAEIPSVLSSSEPEDDRKTKEPEQAELPRMEQESPEGENLSGDGQIRYDEQTYQLVTDIIFTLRNQGEDGEASVRSLLKELEEADPALGKLWTGIVDYWFYVSRDLVINTGTVPDGLPEDDSLGIVVLGFQLLYDGGMTPELIGRCETALAGARRYPEARIVVTGGGTAAGNREATEAGVMADWFAEHGIPRDRIVVENKSLTTDQNAAFACRILAEQYPGIQALMIVTSDYHVALGSMLFTEAALLYACEHECPAPYQVVSNSAFATSGNPIYSNPRRFTSDVWILADPKY